MVAQAEAHFDITIVLFNKSIIFICKLEYYLVDWVQHKLTEPSDISISTSLVPFLFFRIEELISPQSFHEFNRFNLEFGGINFSKLFQGESPSVKT